MTADPSSPAAYVSLSADELLSPLATPSATRAVLEKHGFSTKHALGQNFLINDAILRKIITLAELDNTDAVLEVGPGIGTLTIALLKNAGQVASIECDHDLPFVLAKTCAPWAERFTLIEGNALDIIPKGLPFMPTKLVSNLPYAIAATVVLGAFETMPTLTQATVMVQAEVADRMAANPGSKTYGAYTVKLAHYARVAGRFIVSPGNFLPPPHVLSSVIRLDRVRRDPYPALATMVDAAFASRRKTIFNSCRIYFGKRVSADKLAHVFNVSGIDPTRRGETLSLDEFYHLARAARATGVA